METRARDQVVPSASRSEEPKGSRAYEPPKLNTLGTIDELTMGGPTPVSDIAQRIGDLRPTAEARPGRAGN
jgi:hypothetical protein